MDEKYPQCHTCYFNDDNKYHKVVCDKCTQTVSDHLESPSGYICKDEKDFMKN